MVSRDDQLKISGEAENVLYAVKAVQGLLGLAGRKETITEQNVRYIINLVKAGNEEHINDIARDVLCVTAKGKPIKPKTLGQKRYVDAIKKNTITLGIGPAGTGKTYLAFVMEYIEGMSLKEYVAEHGGSISYTEALACPSTPPPSPVRGKGGRVSYQWR